MYCTYILGVHLGGYLMFMAMALATILARVLATAMTGPLGDWHDGFLLTAMCVHIPTRGNEVASQ